MFSPLTPTLANTENGVSIHTPGFIGSVRVKARKRRRTLLVRYYGTATIYWVLARTAQGRDGTLVPSQRQSSLTHVTSDLGKRGATLVRHWNVGNVTIVSHRL